MTNFRVPSILFYDRNGNIRGVKGTVNNEEAENLYQLAW